MFGNCKPCESTEFDNDTHWLPFPHVPRVKPAILVNAFFRLLLVIQVSLEHIRPVKAHLAHDIRKEPIRTRELDCEKKRRLKIVIKIKSFTYDSVIFSPRLFRPWRNIPSLERRRVLFCCMATEDPRDL